MPDGEVSDSGHRSLFQATKPDNLEPKRRDYRAPKWGHQRKAVALIQTAAPTKVLAGDKNQNIFIADPSLPLIDQPSIPGHSTTMSEPASVNSTLAMA